jgi:hypothetical protein
MRGTLPMSPAVLRSLSLGALLLGAAACGDSRLKDLSIGMGRDSVAIVMEADAPHRSESYLLDGKFWEIFYYPRGDVPSTDSLAWREMSPVVLADGKVAGWGWSYWEGEAERLNIPLAPQE